MRRLLLLALTLGPLALSCTKDEPTPPPPEPPPEPDCGNGMLEEGEVCEGMPTPTGCNPNTCQVEVGFACSPTPPDTSEGETDEAFEPIPWDSSCEELNTCGDGLLDPGEDCDDGDEQLGDGCSMCTVDPLWQCVTEMGMASECWLCGDGFLDSAFGEECDDGHEADGVGMDTPGCENCMVQEGWTCSQGADQTSFCQPMCGDGIWFDDSVDGVNLASAEECDDGNMIDGDGCDANCNIEDGCDCDGDVGSMTTCMCGTEDSSSGSDSGSSSGSSDSGSSSDSGTTGGSSGTDSGGTDSATSTN
ncbi:MAG: DUF4215 domain-containing protein [Myxococcota bacterium]